MALINSAEQHDARKAAAMLNNLAEKYHRTQEEIVQILKNFSAPILRVLTGDTQPTDQGRTRPAWKNVQPGMPRSAGSAHEQNATHITPMKAMEAGLVGAGSAFATEVVLGDTINPVIREAAQIAGEILHSLDPSGGNNNQEAMVPGGNGNNSRGGDPFNEGTPTKTETATFVPASATASATEVIVTPTQTSTDTLTPTPTITLTNTTAPSATFTSSFTPSKTDTPTPTFTATWTETSTVPPTNTKNSPKTPVRPTFTSSPTATEIKVTPTTPAPVVENKPTVEASSPYTYHIDQLPSKVTLPTHNIEILKKGKDSWDVNIDGQEMTVYPIKTDKHQFETRYQTTVVEFSNDIVIFDDNSNQIKNPTIEVANIVQDKVVVYLVAYASKDGKAFETVNGGSVRLSPIEDVVKVGESTYLTMTNTKSLKLGKALFYNNPADKKKLQEGPYYNLAITELSENNLNVIDAITANNNYPLAPGTLLFATLGS